MDNASNKGLYTLIAIVVFGIFISLSYWLFQDQMKSVLADVMFNTGEMADTVLSPDYYGDNYFAKPTGSENFRYDIVGGGVRLASYTGTSKDVVVPYELDGYPVTSIASTIFYNKGLNTLILPNTIKIIEALPAGSNWTGAFSYNNLTELVIPEGVEILGKACFYNNPIENVTFPSTLKVIEFDSFSENNITSVTFPEGLTTIGGYAFNENRLTTLTLPNSLTSIEGFAFNGNRLTSVTIPQSVTSIGSYAFANNPLTSARVPTSTVIQSNAFPATTVITRY